jgi:hypothetical protein
MRGWLEASFVRKGLHIVHEHGVIVNHLLREIFHVVIVRLLESELGEIYFIDIPLIGLFEELGVLVRGARLGAGGRGVGFRGCSGGDYSQCEHGREDGNFHLSTSSEFEVSPVVRENVRLSGCAA